jgi:hypothetical protein
MPLPHDWNTLAALPVSQRPPSLSVPPAAIGFGGKAVAPPQMPIAIGLDDD